MIYFDEVGVRLSSVRGKAHAMTASFFMTLMSVALEDGIVSESCSTLVS